MRRLYKVRFQTKTMRDILQKGVLDIQMIEIEIELKIIL